MRPGNNNPKPLSESERIKQLVVRVGDDGPSFFARDITKLSSNLLTYYQKIDQASKDQTVDLLAECVCSLTQKASIYATVMSLISLQNPSFPDLVIDKIHEKLRIALEKGDLSVPKSVLMFLGELVNIGLFNRFIYINVLLDLIHEAEKTLDKSGDYYLEIGVSVLPYVMETLKEKNKLELNSLMQNIDKLMSRREKNYLKALQIRKDKPSLVTRLDLLWAAIKNYIESGKKSDLTAIVRPYEEFQKDLVNIKESTKKNVKIQFTAKDSNLCVYQSPPTYSFFDEDVLKSEVPSALDLSILRERIVEILTIFDKSKKLAAQLLLKIDETSNCDHLIIESIFGEMFNLPNSSSRLVFYTTLLLTLINDAPPNKKDIFKKIVYEIANDVFKQCENYDAEILDRFALWFAHYLSNTNFEWDWSDWKYVADTDTSSPEALIMRNILTKIVQISFQERILEVLPDDLKGFMPAQELSYFEYDNEEAPNRADVDIIKEKLNAKLPAIEMTQFFQSGDNNLQASNEQLLDIFIQCILQRASKTLTHFYTHLERYHTTITQMITKESDQYIVLDAIRKFWKGSAFHVVLNITSMETAKILNSKEIVTWAFKGIEKEDDAVNNFHLYWEIIFATIEKNLSETTVIREELDKVRDKNKEKSASLEKELGTILEEQQIIFSVIFKEIHRLVSEVFSGNQGYTQILTNRLIQFARKYRKETDNVLSSIEEDLSKAVSSKVSETLSQIREIRFAQAS